MESVNYSELRSRLAEMLDRVNDDHAPLLITRQGERPAVLMSLEDFRSFEETAYLMASPENAKRLNRAIAEIEAGRSRAHDLIAP